MFFKKKEVLDIERYKKIYEKYYEKILCKLENTSFSKNLDFELLPALYVIFKNSAALAEKDKKIKDGKTILHSIFHLIITEYLSNKKEISLFLERVNLYDEVISGLPLRSESTYCKPVPKEVRCIEGDTWTIFSDILINPKCADNYVNAEKAFLGPTRSMEFQQVMWDVYDDFIDLFEEIYNV